MPVPPLSDGGREASEATPSLAMLHPMTLLIHLPTHTPSQPIDRSMHYRCIITHTRTNNQSPNTGHPPQDHQHPSIQRYSTIA